MLELEYRQLLSILRKVIEDDYQIPAELFAEEVNWKRLYELAVMHDLAGWLYPGTKELAVPENVTQIYKTAYLKSVRKEAIVHVELTAYMQELEKNGIAYAPLKGWFLKELYPSPELRTMTDVDLLVKAEDFEAACKLLESRDFVLDTVTTYHYAYMKKPVTQVEIHNRLFAEKSVLYHTFAHIWDRMEAVEHGAYTMNATDLYIYMIAHLAKHFTKEGAGVRNVIDLYLYQKAHKFNDEEQAYINGVLSEIRLNTFAERVSELGNAWFAEGDWNAELMTMADYVISGGLYGKLGNQDALKVAQDQNRNKLKWLLKEAFPSVEEMNRKMHTQSIKKAAMPYYWLKWVLRGIFFRRDKMKIRMSTLKKDETELNQVKNMFDYLGLNSMNY